MNAIVTQMIILFIIVIIGYFLSKKKMMDADFDRKLSVLVINVTCPSLILSSVMGDTLPDKGFILPLLVVGFATYAILIGEAFILPRFLPVKMSERGIYSFMLAFGNVGFIGYPIVASIFGANAVFYACILNFPSTLLIFVFGTLFISGGESKIRFDWRTLYCPAMIASYLSILIVVTGWTPPKVLSTPFTLLGNITVPAALLIVGSAIAQVPIRRMFGNTAIYLMSALRLVLIPLLILYISRLCRIEETIANINAVLAAMPVASYGTLFCIQYEKGEVIMAEGTFITTLLSVVSIPVLTMFL
ncbi:AEC family transporter [uncultured Phocaeicola sp.]|uniref:AEC family transporter n=1 Tax=uncultured Phocaeicola sp. TaxID=990718 RepID=UPI0025EEC8A0|nr:AEC family transporter [uncultured Phocaeicola sp.]